MNRTPEHVVHVTACGEPVMGVWCASCALPSAVALVLLVETDPKVLSVCADCGRRWV